MEKSKPSAITFKKLGEDGLYCWDPSFGDKNGNVNNKETRQVLFHS